MIIREYKKLIRFCHKKATVFKVCENEMVSVRKAKETFKILSRECENDLQVACNIFLNYMKTKCAREMEKYVKFNLKKKC